MICQQNLFFTQKLYSKKYYKKIKISNYTATKIKVDEK